MNLHFKDPELFEKLKQASIHRAVIGSAMYGTNDANSDLDYLYIYVPSVSERNTFFPSHHQLQFKEDAVDHNFVNIFTFLKNCINGDSVVNFEIINHDSIKESELKFLWDLRVSFYNYKTLRSYNGLGRRDIKEIPKQVHDYDKNKKIAHALRSHEFSKMVLSKSFNPVISSELKEQIVKIKALTDWRERKETTEAIRESLEQFRIHISELYNSDGFPLPSFMNVKDQEILDQHLSKLIHSEIWKAKSNWQMNLNAFYEVNEDTDIRYE